MLFNSIDQISRKANIQNRTLKIRQNVNIVLHYPKISLLSQGKHKLEFASCNPKAVNSGV